MKLFVAGLPYDFDDVDLREMFELYGEVTSAKVALDRETRKIIQGTKKLVTNSANSMTQ